jgi:hypothetical protein
MKYLKKSQDFKMKSQFCETYAYLDWRSCNTGIGKDFQKLQVLRPHLWHRSDLIPNYKLQNRRSPQQPGRPAETTGQLETLPKYCAGRSEVLRLDTLEGRFVILSG